MLMSRETIGNVYKNYRWGDEQQNPHKSQTIL